MSDGRSGYWEASDSQRESQLATLARYSSQRADDFDTHVTRDDMTDEICNNDWLSCTRQDGANGEDCEACE